MAKRADLKQKLKAADRRRQRRHVDAPAASASPRSTPAATEVDVTGLVVQTILSHASTLSDARDVMVIAAIKSSLRATTPSGDDAKELSGQLNAIPSKPGVSMRVFRETLQQMLSIANANHDPRSADGFLRYLSLLSES